tara:strand:+ start:623 stop:772 length:150 start_codon:yes stop_codon:yes gene_type:complete
MQQIVEVTSIARTSFLAAAGDTQHAPPKVADGAEEKWDSLVTGLTYLPA